MGVMGVWSGLRVGLGLGGVALGVQTMWNVVRDEQSRKHDLYEFYNYIWKLCGFRSVTLCNVFGDSLVGQWRLSGVHEGLMGGLGSSKACIAAWRAVRRSMTSASIIYIYSWCNNIHTNLQPNMVSQCIISFVKSIV